MTISDFLLDILRIAVPIGLGAGLFFTTIAITIENTRDELPWHFGQWWRR